MKIKTTILLLCPLLFAGCASIVDGGPKTVQVNSNPQGAKVTIYNKAGRQVVTEITPAKVKLARASGFAGDEDYKLVFEKTGYYPYEAHVKSAINGWYWGNIVFGGLIGCIVDMGTGSCYTLKPTELTLNLVSADHALTPVELKAEEAKANPPPKPKPVTSPKGGK
jgi:hypothetical protein